MSTKATEALIEKMEERAFRETFGTAMAAAARAELEAIRRAVKRLAVDGYLAALRKDGHGAEADCLEAIVREAP